MAAMTLNEFIHVFKKSGCNVHLIMHTCKDPRFPSIVEIKASIHNIKDKVETLYSGAGSINVMDVEILSASTYLNSYDNIITHVLMARDLTAEQ